MVCIERPTGALPLVFSLAIEETVRETLREGLHGWEVHAIEQRLAGVTRGEGKLTTAYAAYAPVTNAIPERERSDHNPLNRVWYLAQVAQG